MIKAAEVIKILQINMYCDKCGKRMKRSDTVLSTYPPTFTYHCECGHTESSRIAYPTQQIFFDEGNAVEIEEIEIQNENL